MTALADRIQELLKRIYRGEVSAAAELVCEVSAKKEPSVVVCLIELLFASNEIVNLAAVAGIEDMVRAKSPMDLLQLDRALRERSEYSWPFQHRRGCGFLVDRSMPDLKRISHNSPTCLGVFASHSDGYIREVAVRILADIRTGAELPFLLIRLNDWVRQVRNAALNAILARLTDDYIPHFIRYLPLVFRLKDQHRADSTIAEQIVALLRRPEAHPRLLVAVSSGDPHAARLAFQVLRDSHAARLALEDLRDAPKVPIQTLLDRAHESWDPIVRLRAAQLARERLTAHELRTHLRRILSDKSMPIRREALYAVHEKLPERAEHHLRAALFDRHAAIRDTARFLLRQRGVTPSASIYRDRLPGAAPHELATLIAALGETGDRSDVSRLTPFLDHPLARVRTAAIRASARLDGDSLAEEFLRLVRDDPSPKVSRTARDAILPRRHLVGFDRIWSVVEGPAQLHARVHALTLLADRDWWTSIEYFLRAIPLENEPLRALALRFIDRRRHEIGRFTRRPSDQQIQQITAALLAAKPYLAPSFVSDLHTGLDYIRRNFPRSP